MADDFDPRRAPDPTWRGTTHDAFGERHELRADDEGVVRPRNDVEVAYLDSLGFPVARKVIQQERAAARETGVTAREEG